MKSGLRGTDISRNEITNISAQGFWLLVENQEYFIPFKDYPVFKGATIEQIFSIKQIAPGQLHWPLLDADVELEALEHPESFPLMYR